MERRGVTAGTCLYLLFCSQVSLALKTYIECDGSHLLVSLDKVFSLDVLVNNASVGHLTDQGVQDEGGGDRVQLTNVSGALTKDRAYLLGSTDVDCDSDHVACELNGYSFESSDFVMHRFESTLEFDVGLLNIKVTKQTLQPSKEVLLTCSVTVGSNRTRLFWRTTSQEGNVTHAQPEADIHRTYLSNCHIQITSHIIYDPRDDGKAKFFHCVLENIEIGSIWVDSGDEANLSTHLFLSTLLVYLHFVILPVVCSCCGGVSLVKKYRDPYDERMRLYRGSVSMLVALGFSIWWLVVFARRGWEFDCYFCFFLIETFFLSLYGIIRLLSHQLEKPGDRHLYNGRVALSCGGVIIPTVSWILIKVQQDLPYTGLEWLWWCVTIFSLLAFVSVSHERELKAWEKVT